MNKKIFYLLTSIAVLVIFIIIGVLTKMINAGDGTFTIEQLNIDSRNYREINDKISGSIKENGIYLLYTGGHNVTYLILDGSHMDLKNEAPYFSDVKIENREDSIMIYFREEFKTYPEGKYPEHRLIYKIKKDKDIQYIRVFKNGEETHFDSVIVG